jgi:hypothetical protein
MALVKYNNNSISAITTAGQVATGSLVPISEQTASGSASISFTTGIDNTYPIYKFEFINIHPVNDGVDFTFNLSTDGGSNYNVTKTSTMFVAYHDEIDANTGLVYSTEGDLAQGTGFNPLNRDTGNGNDESLSGSMELFNPASSVFVKHWISRVNSYQLNNNSQEWNSAGYGNTTSSVNAIQFKFASGNIDSGTIKLYGIKDS